MMLTSTTTSNPCRHECFHIRFLSSCSITLLLLLVVVVSRTNAFATHYNVCVNKTRFEEVRRNGLGPACIGVTLQATKHRQTSDNDTELSLGFGSSCFESNSCTLSFIAYKDDRTSETSKFAFYAESFKNDTVAIVPVVDLYITQEPIDNFEVHPLDYTYGTVMAKNLGGGRTPLGVYNLHTGVAVLVSSNKSDSDSKKSLKRYLMNGNYGSDRIHGSVGHIFGNVFYNEINRTSAEIVFAAKDRIYAKDWNTKNNPDFDWTTSPVFIYAHLYHQVYRKKGESRTGQWTRHGLLSHVVSLSFSKPVFLLRDFMQKEEEGQESSNENSLSRRLIYNRMSVLPPHARKVVIPTHDDSLTSTPATFTFSSTETKRIDPSITVEATTTVKSMEKLPESKNRVEVERVTSSSMVFDNNLNEESKSSLNSVQLDYRTDSETSSSTSVLTEGLEQRPLLQEHHHDKQGDNKLDTKYLVIGIILTTLFVIAAVCVTIFITLKTKSRIMEEECVEADSVGPKPV